MLLKSGNFQKLPLLFQNVELHYRIDAIAAGTSPGKVWVNDVEAPRTAFIWDGAHGLYFGGSAADESFNNALQTLLTESILVEAQQRGLQILKIHTTDRRWTETVDRLFHPYTVQRRARVLYGLDTRPFDDQDTGNPNLLPNRLKLTSIDADFLSQRLLPQMDEVRREIESGWISLERFLQDGFGYCVVHEVDAVVGWCTAEYVSVGTCGVGIETIEAYQGRGLATMLASAFVREATARRWQVYWDSWLANTPSVRVAEKLGFEKVTEYEVFLVSLE